MPIPPFDEHGLLPPGVHPATLEEIEERFGRQSEERRAQMESLRWTVDLARRAGVWRIVINGSFVTHVVEPNDVDCVLLIESGFPKDPAAEKELRGGLPFLSIELAGPKAFNWMVERFFATDRFTHPKGMVKVIL